MNDFLQWNGLSYSSGCFCSDEDYNHRSRDCRGVKAIGKRETGSRCWGMQDLPPKRQVGIKTLCETHSVGSKALCSAASAFCTCNKTLLTRELIFSDNKVTLVRSWQPTTPTIMGGGRKTLFQMIAVTSDYKIPLQTDAFMPTASKILDLMVLHDVNVYF